MTPYGTAPPAPARGSLGLALVCGLGAAIGGAVVWALVAYISKHQFSIVAVLMGLAVGSAVARFRSRDLLAAVASAVLAVLGCAFGSFLALVFALAGAGVSVGSILGHLNLIIQAYPHSLGGLALLFWLIAAFIGFRIPFSKTGLGGVARRRRGQFPASGAPAQPWSVSQAGQPSFGQPPADQPQAGQPSFGQPPADQPQAGQPSFGRYPAAQPPFDQAQAAQPSFGQSPAGQFPTPGAGDQPDSGHGG
jgi:MFS family permease